MNGKRISTLFIVIVLAQSNTGYAMLSTMRLAALRSNLYPAAAQLISPIETDPSNALFAQRPKLLARGLSAHRHAYNEDKNYQSSDENNSQSDSNSSWWQNFHSRFARGESTPMLGLSLFGYHFWWSDADICQTPEDFRNPEKLARTKECFAAGKKNRVFDVFMRNFDAIKDDKHALNKVLEFLYATFDDFKTDNTRIAMLLYRITSSYGLIEKNRWGKKLLTKIAKEHSFLQDALSIQKLFATSSTQSAKHFKALINPNFTKMNEIAKHTPSGRLPECLFNIVQTVLTVEKEEQDKGNYTFVHTYHWDIHFFQDIDAHLRHIAYGVKKQSLSLRFIKKPNEKKQQAFETHRKELLTKSNFSYFADEGLQKRILFMNYALFTGFNENFKESPYLSNALYFFLHNRSEKKPTLHLEKIAKHLNMEVYFERYAQEFTELQQLHAAASTYGAGIIFSFTPEMLHKSVYVANPGGGRRTVYIKHYGWTDDVQLILDTLRTAPEKIIHLDKLEFVFVVTKDCALNPRVQEAEAYKTIPFNAADPKKLALYEQKRDELMAKIKADIKAERAAWSKQKKLGHDKTMKQMNELFAKYSCLNDCTSGQRIQA